MEEQVDRLVKKVWEKYQSLPASKRYLIAVAGVPGSGKTTLASTVASRLNALYLQAHPYLPPSDAPIAAFIPMDGYHLTRAQLSALPDPTTAHARRGAAFTFDGAAFLHLVRQLRAPIAPETHTVHAPSFDHAVKDPVPDDIAIHPTHRLLLFEGNYLHLDRPPWRDAAALMDERWFVAVDLDVARRRLCARHLAAGLAATPEEAVRRVEENDLLNAKEILANRLPCDEEIESREDEAWSADAQGVREADAEEVGHENA